MPRDSSPTIQEFRVRAVRVPMAEPHRTASGVVTESPLVLTDIITDTGISGHSMVFTYTPAALKPTAELIRNFEPLVKGERTGSRRNRAKARQAIPLARDAGPGRDRARRDRYGPVGCAGPRSQRAARAVAGRGGEAHSPPTGRSGTTAWQGAQRPPNTGRREDSRGSRPRSATRRCTRTLPLCAPCGRPLAADMSIMVDYNQCLTPTEAVERLRVLDDEGLTWVEEPTLAHDYAGHALVAREARTPIQCGENWWGTLDMQHAIEAHASDLVMPDVMKIGGVTGWLRAATLAHAKGLQVSNHLWPEISARLLCCTPTAHWLEYADWWNPILAEPLRVEKGMAIVDDAIGTGVEWNEDAVRRFAA